MTNDADPNSSMTNDADPNSFESLTSLILRCLSAAADSPLIGPPTSINNSNNKRPLTPKSMPALAGPIPVLLLRGLK